ncbi:MAG TPA: Ig-like domain repeat protein [Edaphobacter sp.]|nr:Ig-like domain repeat protein [Edaphobacter sp.]
MLRVCRALVVAIAAFYAAVVSAQVHLPVPQSRIVQAVDDSRRTTLMGNTHPLARAEFDRGSLADETPLRRMQLVLQRSSQQEEALKQLLDQQQDTSSSAYHQWLTPEAFGAAFGPSDRDLSEVTSWLSAHGFSGIQVNPGRTLIEFSGTAGAVRSSFHTQMHRYSVGGEQHFANAADPQIPVAFAPVVAGIASLNSFHHKPASRKTGRFRRDTRTNLITRMDDQTTTQTKTQARPRATLPNTTVQPNFTVPDGATLVYGVTPYDFATIYNVLPLWNASTPIDGTGQTIAIVGETDINPADFVNFRKLFHLPIGDTNTPTGTQYLNIIHNGPSPGVGADEGEADIDTEWSSAVAKGATIDYVVSESTEVTQGTDLSAIYIISNNLAPVMSFSYGQCELFLGTSGNAFFNNLWQQAAAQGITVLIASGDSGAAACEASNANYAVNGLAVNGLGSTPYNIAVGGTDFYMPTGGAMYWNSANDPTTQASAKGYIPEAAWNDSCANSVFSTLSIFSGQTAEQICNSATAINDGFVSVVGAGGGASSCTQSNGSSSSSCKGGYSKPSWQTGAGVPADGVRDIPDVSLFASNGFFNAFYVVCQQSSNTDGQPCGLTYPVYDFVGYGGTSVSAPAFAGIMSLVNQKMGNRVGNANYVLYNLASRQNTSGTACNSSTGAPASGCIFNDVTTDTISQPCLKGTPNCTVTNSSDRYGVLAGWGGTTGYDLATGLGSVNVANLVNNWTSSSFRSTTTSLSLSPLTIPHGSPVTATVKVVATTGTPTGNVSINALATNGSLGGGTLTSGAVSLPLSGFPGGSYSVQAHYAGDGTFAASDSNAVAITVTPEGSSTKLQLLLVNPSSGDVSSISSGMTFPYGGFYLVRADVAGVSGQGSATGNVVITDAGLPLDGGTFRLNSTADTEDQTTALAPGVHSFAAAYAGDASFNASQSAPVALTITKAQTTSSLTARSTFVSSSATVTLTTQIKTQAVGNTGSGGFGLYAPSGIVTFKSGDITLGTALVTQSAFPASVSDSASAVFTFPASLLAVGNNDITVSYPGDTNYNPSSSSAITINVMGSALASSVTAITLSAATVAPRTPYMFTAQVTPTTPYASGTVQFTSDGQAIGKPLSLSLGQATLSSSLISLASGTHMIAAVYSGDVNYRSSASAPATFTITSPTVPSTTTVSVTPETVVQGGPVTVLSTIKPSAATGTAQLLLDGSPYGQPLVVSSGGNNLPLSTATLEPGSHVLQVSYSGDATYLPSVSSGSVLNILASVGTFTFSSSGATTTVARGGTSAPIVLTAIPLDGFHSTISFACSGGMPAGATCSFAPASVTPTGPAALPISLTVAMSTISTQTTDRKASGLFPWLPFTTGVAISGIFLVGVPRRNRWRSMVLLLLAFVAFASVSGCGSGLADTRGNSNANSAPGTYSITVTASGGSTIQTATVSLVVQ